MHVALPFPHEAHPDIALGADYSSRRLIDSIRTHAPEVMLDIFSQQVAPTHASPGSWDLLHDVRPAGDPRRYFSSRSRLRKRFPIVHTHHAINYPYYLDRYFLPLLLARAQEYDAVVCQSAASRAAFENLLSICAEAVARDYRRNVRYDGQLPVIPNGVDTDLFRPRDTADVRHQLRLPADAFVLLWLGRLSATTKADLIPLLNAYALLRERNQDRRLLLVLVGTDQEHYGSVLSRYAATLGLAEHVRLEPVRPKDPAHLWYSAADVFVSPVDNVQESFGNTPIEAMASGVPQVVTDWDGYRDTVRHGETGFRVRTYWAPCDDDAVIRWTDWGDAATSQALLAQAVAYDPSELTAYLECLVRSPQLRLAMSVASRTLAVREFAWSAIARRYVDCWKDLVERSSRSAAPAPAPIDIEPAYFRAFAGYASHILSDDAVIRIHPDLTDACDDEEGIAAAGYESAQEGMPAPDVQMAHGLELVLEAVGTARDGMSITQVIASADARAYAANDIRRLVLRGIKYGLLQVVSEPGIRQRTL